MKFADATGLGREFSKDPCVVKYNKKYFLYYSLWVAENGQDKLHIGIAESDDMENWNIAGRFSVSEPYEKNGVGAPGAIVLNGVIHLFYQTYGNFPNDEICHAISKDGINFIKDKTPIFQPTKDWCCGRAIDADVVAWNERLYLYFATRDRALKIQKIGVASADLSSDFSRNCWKQELAQSVLTPEFPFEGECIEAPAVIENDGLLYMFYGGGYNCSPQQIGVAVSKDGIHFDKLSDLPFLSCGKKGEWNSDESGHPYVFRDDDGRTYLFYQGTNDMGKNWYLSKCEIAFKDGKPFIVSK